MQQGESEHRLIHMPLSTPRWPEARFRITAANASRRMISVIYLNDADADVALFRSRAPQPSIAFIGPADLHPSTRADAIGQERVQHCQAKPDLVVIVGEEGDDPTSGIRAAREYRDGNITVSGLIRRRRDAGATDSSTSDALRPFCTTMLLVNDTGYLDDLLDALGVREQLWSETWLTKS